ncbi:MAG: hypothetical protein Unbinned834contig1000_27 [Prokaryotic dsDNA virus sp.]|nr:MAG: hypothetical protein Unbinned834contig1000_27 [Prokaryotic dsDNA virus sp.]|tara:strand:- start:144 stop:554 length:411 start_codon:yes stop_codon:yes gene_type:complete
MAHIYDSGRQYLAVGSVNLATATLKIALVNTTANANSGYIFSAAHTMLSDIPAVAQVSNQTLANVAVASGRVDADNLSFSLSGNPVNAIVLYIATANSSTSPLLFIQSEGSGFPTTPDGGTFTVTFASSDPFIMKV